MANPPSLTANLERGHETNFWGKLQGKGVMPEDVAEAGKSPAMIEEIVAVFLKYRLFATPEEQIATILRINEAIWKDRSVTEKAIRALGDPPVCPSSEDQHLWCTVLLRETGDAVRTFGDNAKALRFIHGEEGSWQWDGIVFTPEGVRLRTGAIARPKGLRWSAAELGRERQNQKVADVRPALDLAKRMGMGQELPLIGALHPKWACAMDGDEIPFVDAPDLEVRPNAGRSFSDAPCVRFNRGTGEVGLDAYDVANRSSCYGSGVLGECHLVA